MGVKQEQYPPVALLASGFSYCGQPGSENIQWNPALKPVLNCDYTYDGQDLHCPAVDLDKTYPLCAHQLCPSHLCEKGDCHCVIT